MTRDELLAELKRCVVESQHPRGEQLLREVERKLPFEADSDGNVLVEAPIRFRGSNGGTQITFPERVVFRSGDLGYIDVSLAPDPTHPSSAVVMVKLGRVRAHRDLCSHCRRIPPAAGYRIYCDDCFALYMRQT